MFYKLINELDLSNYPHLQNKQGNMLISDSQVDYYDELSLLIDKADEYLNSLTDRTIEIVNETYNNIYQELHKNIRSRITTINIDDKILYNLNKIKLGLTQSGKDPESFTSDEILILKLCEHIALFDIYSIPGIKGEFYRRNLMKERDDIINKYLYNQEVLKVLKEDGFLVEY